MLKFHARPRLPLIAILLFSCLFFVPAAMLAQQAPAQPGEIQIPISYRSAGVDVLGEREICEGSETTLEVDGEYESYSWNTGSTERSIKVKEAGIYEVTVKTKGGCTFTTGVNVRMKPCT